MVLLEPAKNRIIQVLNTLIYRHGAELYNNAFIFVKSIHEKQTKFVKHRQFICNIFDSFIDDKPMACIGEEQRLIKSVFQKATLEIENLKIIVSKKSLIKTT